MLFFFVSLPVTVIIIGKLQLDFSIFRYFEFIQILSIPSLILLIYSIYFYYKYDKYSSSGFKLLFLSVFYTPFYFYNVIWKRKRHLITSYKSEPVLGNTIHLETFEEDDDDINKA